MPLQTLTPELAAQIAAKYPALQSLNLSNNALRDVNYLQLLPRTLTQLDLSGNCLLALPQELGAWLPALRLLRLRANALESLRPLLACRQLQTLDIGANHVMLASELRFLQPLPQLRHLSLDANPLAEAPTYRRDTLARLLQLHTLDGQQITGAERLLSNLQQKTPMNNRVVASFQDPLPAPSPRLLTPESLQGPKPRTHDVTDPLVTSVPCVALMGAINASLPHTIPFAASAPQRPAVLPQVRTSKQQDHQEPTNIQAVPDQFHTNIKTRNQQLDTPAALNVKAREALLTCRVEALERILAVQDKTIKTSLRQFGKHSFGSHSTPSNQTDAAAVEAAATVYTRLLAAWREKTVALMVQAQSNALANETRTQDFRRQEAQKAETLARCEAQLEMWQQRAANIRAQRDLEVVATRQADFEREQAHAKTVQAVRGLTREREKLETIVATVVQFTGGLMRDKVDELHRGAARLQALARRLELAKERIALVSTLVIHREARVRNSEAALEADRRVWAHRLAQLRKQTRLRGQEPRSEDNGHIASVAQDGTRLRSATATALRTLFHRLDCFDTGLVPSHVLLQALRQGESTDLSAVVSPEKLAKLVAHVEAALTKRCSRSTLTWGEFLLLFMPESSALPSEDADECDWKVTRLDDANVVCSLCTALNANALPRWSFAVPLSPTQQRIASETKTTQGVDKRRARKALETLSHAELVHQVTVVRADRQRLWNLLARDAYDVRARVRLVQREWHAKTSALVHENETQKRDLNEQAAALLQTQQQQAQAEQARDEAVLETQRLRERLATQEHDFALQKKAVDAQHVKRLQHEHESWQTEIQEAHVAHSLLQRDFSKQQVHLRQLERDLARQKNALLAHETERVASVEDKVRRRDSEVARLRRERNTILNALREHEQKLAIATAPKEMPRTESSATQTEQAERKTVASQTHAMSTFSAGDKRNKITNDSQWSGNEISPQKYTYHTLNDAASPIGTKDMTRPTDWKITPADVNLRLQKLQTLTASLLADY